LSISIYL